jgi:hypothetical protein
MATTSYIPRQSDLEIIAALSRVQASGDWNPALKIFIHLDHQGWAELPNDHPEAFEQIQFALKLNSTVLSQFQIQNSHRIVLNINRDFAKPWDSLTVADDWINAIPDAQTRTRHYVEMVASARAELKAPDLDASLKGASDDAWNRYRDAQMAVVNSLQQASETLLIKTAERNAELDRDRSARFEKLERELRDEIFGDRQQLQLEFEAKEKVLADRTKQLTDREAAFNTEEARYVARKKQEEQMEQLKNWMKSWNLTSGTTKKRWPIFGAYVAALVITGCLTAYATYHNFQILKSADDIAKLQWWHWLAIISKSFFPLAAFTTFMVYFIRWSSGWARQHADEEFINRTRLIDIGRSAWLLEAVRDAQERNKEIPPELLKELSRNLFTHTASNDGDVQPQAAADILLQGLSSLRVKSADGTEVEAKRGK